jgi:orotate phosphoribosyltransferase
MTTIKPTLDLAARAAIAARTEALFRASGAFREGHVVLEDGRHADAELEPLAVLADPTATSELCGYLAARLRELGVDVVAGPTTGGAILAFETARQLGRRAIFAEAAPGGDPGAAPWEFRGRLTIGSGERVVLVDDILTTGASLRGVIAAVESLGGEIVACEVLVDRAGARATLTSPTSGRRYPLRALWSLDLPAFAAGAPSCPRCVAGQPLGALGSMGDAARTPSTLRPA